MPEVVITLLTRHCTVVTVMFGPASLSTAVKSQVQLHIHY